MKNFFRTLFIMISLTILVTAYAYTHGVEITHEWSGRRLVITCVYDDGTAMAGATVDIFSPQDPATPYDRGQTDSNGQVALQPDKSVPGEWTIRARLAGHGGVSYFTLEKAPFFSGERLLQILLFAALGVFTVSFVRYSRKSVK